MKQVASKIGVVMIAFHLAPLILGLIGSGETLLASDAVAAENSPEKAVPQPGEAFTDTLRSGGQGPWLVVIPAGRFRMGCVSGQDCLQSAKPVHEVTIPNAFAVSKYEITFEDYDRYTLEIIDEETASGSGQRWAMMAHDEGWGRGRRPVINVPWTKAIKYVKWLSQQTGEKYRLLTEAEWEYVARAGSSEQYSWGNRIGRNMANCSGKLCGDQFKYTAPVGSFESNSFGVHDMHGNVREWVEDSWNSSYAVALADENGNSSQATKRRVIRGGSWNHAPWQLGSVFRDWSPEQSSNFDIGFRVARTLTP